MNRGLNNKCLNSIHWLRWSMVGLICFCNSIAWADRAIEESFAVTKGGWVKLKTDIGSIRVITHSKDSIDVTVDIKGLDEDEFEVNFDLSGDTLSIDGDRMGSYSGWGRKGVRFSLTVPEEFNLDMRTAGGSINVADLKGKVDVNTSGGSLRFGNIEGPIRGDTSGGSISVEGARGNVKVRTSGGSLTLGDIEGELHARTSGGSIRLGLVNGDANVATSGGSIRIEGAGGNVQATTSGGSIEVTFTKQPKGDSELSTSGGSITAYLAEFIAVDIYARGRRVKSDFEINGKTSAKNKLRGPINGGGPELEMRTSAGSVYIRKN